MKLADLVLVASLVASASAGSQLRRGTSSASGCCKFTLSAGAPFSCPAGQLPDGQIRLNGSEPTSTFCIDQGGKITDQNGYGCIVTDPPTTQIQCNKGADPVVGFSIGSDETLQYQGSSQFYACPATDTEWNIYVSPNFGQPKCIPVKLVADGCGTQTPSCSAPPASTVYQTQVTTQWITQWITQKVNNNNTSVMTTTETETDTETETITQPCTSSTKSGCNKCSRKTTLPSSSSCSSTSSSFTGWNSTTTMCTKCLGTGTSMYQTSATDSF
ncbi:hypothetical protein AB5N19_12560 [Seiridium cardinale]